MIDFDKMDGYEFESLIGELLKRMGFEVEITQGSGDGGVDVIATSREPITKGRYLVQCKHWNSQVGQPAVRDLYGVVMCERANKGILITTDSFTNQALSFAMKVGIECIDGKELLRILNKYDMLTNINKSEKNFFYEYVVFNRLKYEYLKYKINREKNNIDLYIELFNFLQKYISNYNIELMYAGLLDEMYDICSQVIRLTKKIDKRTREKYVEYQIQIDFLRGNILETFENSECDKVFLPTNQFNEKCTNNIIVLSRGLNYDKIFNYCFYPWLNKLRKVNSYDDYINETKYNDDYDRDIINIGLEYWCKKDTIDCFRCLEFERLKPYITSNKNLEKDKKTIEMLISNMI